MHAFHFALSFVLLASVARAAYYPVVPESIMNVLQNLSKPFKFNADIASSYGLFEFYQYDFHMTDLVTLSKKRLNESLLLNIIHLFASQGNVLVREMFYNTLTDEYCDMSSDEVNEFTILNDSFAYNVFLLGTVIKDEFGLEKRVLNCIYISDISTGSTTMLQFAITDTPLEYIAELILGQAPNENISEKLSESLSHLYQRNEQILQLFFQCTEKGSFPESPFLFYRAILGGLLVCISTERIADFSVLLPESRIKDYFECNWLYFTNYHSQLVANADEITLNDDLYKEITNDFGDYQDLVQIQFESIFGLKNYWNAKATGLNAILQAFFNLQSFVDRLYLANADSNRSIPHNGLVGEFVKLMDFASQARNALKIYDTTKIFDLVSLKFGELHDPSFGYNLKKLLFVILKELSKELHTSPKQHEVPSDLVKGVLEIGESSCSEEEGTYCQEFEYVFLSVEQFVDEKVYSIKYFLENLLFQIDPLPLEGSKEQIEPNECCLRQSQSKRNIVVFPRILVVAIEEFNSVSTMMEYNIDLGNTGNNYNLKAVVSRFQDNTFNTRLFFPDKLPVCVQDASISLIEEESPEGITGRPYLLFYERETV